MEIAESITGATNILTAATDENTDARYSCFPIFPRAGVRWAWDVKVRGVLYCQRASDFPRYAPIEPK